jgi:hypothetical protein
VELLVLNNAAIVERVEYRGDRRFELGIDPGGAGGDQRRGDVAFTDGAGLRSQSWQVAT